MGELFKGQYRDTANIFVLESLEKMYKMGAFHFGHFDRDVIVISIPGRLWSSRLRFGSGVLGTGWRRVGLGWFRGCRLGLPRIVRLC